MVLTARDADEERGLLDYEVLLMLDHTPSSVEALAKATGKPAPRIQEVLARAEADGLAIDWGEVWATTWRAKLTLEPGFFRLWVPASVAAGAAITVIALATNGPSDARGLLPWFAAVAGLGVAGAFLEVVKGGRR